MKTQSNAFTLVLLLRLTLGALLLAHAFLGLVALGVPVFAAALVAQGMPTQDLPIVLLELAGAMLVLLGSHGWAAALPQDPRAGSSPAGAFNPR